MHCDENYLILAKPFQQFQISTTTNMGKTTPLWIKCKAFLSKQYLTTEHYMRSKSYASRRRLNLSKDENNKDYIVLPEKVKEVIDVFEGVHVKWKYAAKACRLSTRRSYVGWFEITVHVKYKDKILNSYLSHISIFMKTWRKKKIGPASMDHNSYGRGSSWKQ